MDPVYELLLGVHILLLLAFIGVTSMLMLVTVINRLRVRDVLLSWPSGRLFGLPLWSSLFLVVVLVFFAISALQDQLLYPMIFAGYLMGGTFWFAASIMMSTVHVTPHGLILNVNRNGRAVAWGQIVDYFEFECRHRGGVVFFYTDGSGSRQRLELFVPRSFRQRFGHVVRARLSGRFKLHEHEPAGRQAHGD